MAEKYLPTPAEIRTMCLEIQSEWSEAERWKRAGHADGKPALEVQRVRVDGRGVCNRMQIA